MENRSTENTEWQDFKNLHIVLNRSGGGWIGEIIGIPGCEACGSSLEECQVNSLVAILDRFISHLLYTMKINESEGETHLSHSTTLSYSGYGLPSVSITNAITKKNLVVLSFPKSPQSLSSQVDEPHDGSESNGGQRILRLLGLPQEASEAEVYEVVKDLKDRVTEAEARLLQIEISEVIAQNNAYISDVEGFKRLYVEHGKDVAVAFLKVMRKKTEGSQGSVTVDTVD